MQHRPGDYPSHTNLRRTAAPNLSQAAYDQLMQATEPMRLGSAHGTYDIGRENAKAELRDIIRTLYANG